MPRQPPIVLPHMQSVVLFAGGNLGKRYSVIDIIVVRIKKEPFGALGMAKPCKHCLQVYKGLGVRGIYYSDEAGKIRYELVKEMQNDHVSKGNL